MNNVPSHSSLLIALVGVVSAAVWIAPAMAGEPQTIAGHTARFDLAGRLLPWTSWNDALEREMRHYQRSPIDHGYPRFVTQTFLQSDWSADPVRVDTIPATQVGMGIVSYLKYYDFRGKRDAVYVETARRMGDYLLAETLTPTGVEWPRFPHSTGQRGQFPLRADSGSQNDQPFEIEPDKGGVVGYALVLLSDATNSRGYRDHAVHIARVLAAHQRNGDSAHSPWPFRVDFRNGNGRGDISGNMTYVLRLFDALLARGYREFATPREALWTWIKHEQIPSAANDGALFAQFFEDHDSPTNRTAWAPLNLARYLLDQREALDLDWRADSKLLIDFVRRTFTHREGDIVVCHEQDEDHDAWNGINSTYGAVLAMYAKASGSNDLAMQARAALDFTIYSIDDDGKPRDLFKHASAGGWQEDAHTDVVHNYVDAMRAFPQWSR